MTDSVLIAGGGIAGLAAAVSMARAGWQATVCERAAVFSEVGAGVQLGPNVSRIVQTWAGEAAMQSVAFAPDRLVARDMASGAALGVLSLKDMQERYGSPYLTMHRADLHGLLLHTAKAQGVALHNEVTVQQLNNLADGVQVQSTRDQEGAHDQNLSTHALAVVADGVWSRLRQTLLRDGEASFTGHVAYRALLAQADLPASLRTRDVTVWMGPQAHVVAYPVRGGDGLNLVCLIEDASWQAASSPTGDEHRQARWQDLQSWNLQHSAAQTQQALQHALRGAHVHVRQLIEQQADWRLWPLCGRPPMRSANDHAQGRVALIGDAAHPMLPYLAQGAGMAIEDAWALAQHVPLSQARDVRPALQRFAQARWPRNARVQQRALRNGVLFHAQGPLRMARDLGLRVLGERVMDMPWLYAHKGGN